jgi:hypothetical protein
MCTASTSTGSGPRWNSLSDDTHPTFHRFHGLCGVVTARHRFSRDRHGRFRCGLGAGERQLLKALPSQVQGLLEQRDPSTKRLFPVAYPNDEHSESEYQEMLGSQLLKRHQLALDVLIATADSASIDAEEINQWLDALEVLRLVLGTQLDVGEEPVVLDEADPNAAQLAVYSYLSMLQNEIVDSLAESLPEEGSRPSGEGP